MYENKVYSERYQRKAEQLTAQLESEIRAWAKQINKGETDVVTLKPQVRKWMVSKNRTVWEESVDGSYSEGIKESKKFFGEAGIDVKLTPEDARLLDTIKKTAFDELGYHTSLDAYQVWRELSKYSVTGNMQALKNGILKNLDAASYRRYGPTIVNTQVDTFHRTVNAMRGKNAGVERWRYVGPSPDRAFCNGIYMQVFTQDEISRMDNGQGLDPFFSGGGYNCRHRWSPVL